MSDLASELVALRTAIKSAEDFIVVAKTHLSAIESMSAAPIAIPTIHQVEAVSKPVELPSPAIETPITITDEWKQVLDILNHGPVGVFVTGPAGTGKSTLLNHFCDSYDGGLAIVAPTGVAALRVTGETIHRFFHFAPHVLEKDDIDELSDDRKKKYKALDVLVIDEVSMVRADMMDAIDIFMRKNGRNSTKPFGGCRIVMFGDPYQLPPVASDKVEKQYLKDRYGTETPYFFHAEVWRENPLKICELTTIFRQKDEKFTAALNAIRSGVITPDYLALINSRVKQSFRPPVNDDLWLTLTTTNNSADQANQRMLAAIDAKAEIFDAEVTGDFDLKNAPTDEALVLKPGCSVMFIRNSKMGGWVNGTMGKVLSLNPLTVEAKGVPNIVERETWQKITYDFNDKTKKLSKKVTGEFSQIPLKLAAAITIHKSQGLTFDRVIIDLAGGAFAAGQSYVALSRCRTLEGMILRRAVEDRDLITSTEVQKFMRGELIAKPEPTPAQTAMF